ncbi:ABC transporter ATP-binding protein [Bosea vaviloviae]|uniref:ABC transporter ATP-binding protein n=1 Tax=Bosea vaviloviae TaxID=1526658 RepID=A0A1D7UC32_9HYPH|nr:ABC transporter ATP-binding protein [Bosea vaviloviae]AOO84933.1 ABC transporter ATP-binding protein [Bosea vaviloviae]
MTATILEARGLTKRFGGLTATDDVTLAIRELTCHALIGPNGAGKTTLLSQLSGELRPTAGQIHFEGRDVTSADLGGRARLGILRSFQITSVCDDYSVFDNVVVAAQIREGHGFRFWQAPRRVRALADATRSVLEQTGLADFGDVPAGVLSHGQRRQLELAIALAMQPRVLLLDEPMAGMGPAEAERMIDLLGSLRADYTIVLVEHDMDAVFNLADTVSVLVGGRLVASGTPQEIRSNASVREAYLGHEQEDAA